MNSSLVIVQYLLCLAVVSVAIWPLSVTRYTVAMLGILALSLVLIFRG